MANDFKERYINPYTDFGFKRLFGTEMNKELLISFLNALFDGTKQEIMDVEYMNSEQLGDGYGDRRAVFDVYCKTADGSRFIVEMQKTSQAYFKDRSLYYSTFAIREQAPQGEWEYHLADVYTVGILNFKFPEGEYAEDSFRHEVKLKDVEDNHVFYDKLTYVYLEMPKFSKSEDELVTLFDKWMFVLKNLARLLERPKALQDRIFDRLFEQAEIAKYSPDERRLYAESKKEFWDYFSTMKTARDEGSAEGRAEGMAEGEAIGMEKGRAEERLKNARSLLANGVPRDVVVKSLGLTGEETAVL